MPASRFRCPECDALIRPPRSDGKKVRCPECDALVRPPGSRSSRPPQRSNAALIAIPIVAFAVLVVGGAIVYAAFFMDKKTEPAVTTVPPAGGPVAKGPAARPGGGVNAAAAPRASGPRVEGLAVDDLAPDIENEDLDGETFKLSDYRGKVVMLDFWGNW